MGSTSSQFGSAGILKERAIQERIAVAAEALYGSQPNNSGVDAFSITYVFPAIDFGGGNKTEQVEGIEGFRGTVKAIIVYECSELFADANSYIDVGIDGGDADAYIDGAKFAALAADASLAADLTAGVVGTIPVGEDILVSMFKPTGATGIATVAVTIQYYR